MFGYGYAGLAQCSAFPYDDSRSKEITNTRILQNPVDYVLAGEGKDDRLPRGKMTQRMMKKIFGE